jgi:hypothetical protein
MVRVGNAAGAEPAGIAAGLGAGPMEATDQAVAGPGR